MFNQRYGAAVRRAKEMMEADGGTLHLITASMYQHWPTQTGGHVTGTFMITDACCHLLDLMTYLCGRCQQVKAIAAKVESELYSDISVSIRFRNGCVGCMSHSNVGGKLDTQPPVPVRGHPHQKQRATALKTSATVSLYIRMTV